MADPDPPPPPKPLPPEGNLPAQPKGEREHFPGLLMIDDAAPSRPKHGRYERRKPRSEMGFFEHLEELRMTIIKCIMVAMVGIGVASVFFVKLYEFLQLPLYYGLGEELASHVLKSPNEPMGKPTMALTVSVYGGILLTLPLIIYFIAKFVSPGLNEREKKLIRPVFYSALGLFFLGAIFCFFIMLPAAIKVSHKLDVWTHVDTVWTENTYYSFVVWGTLGAGLVFQFPLILVLMQTLGIISPDTLRSSRRYAIVIIAVISMIIAPSPDPTQMLALMAPLYLLFEGSIIVGAALRKRKLAAEARRNAEYSG